MEEVYQKFIDHQLVGIMLYEEASNCMDLLNLHGYKRAFEYFAMEEFCERKHIDRYFINHYGKLLKENNVEKISIIPAQYYNASREEIGKEYKKDYIKTSLAKVKDYYKQTIGFLNIAIKQSVEENKIEDMCLFKNRLECYNQRLKKLNRHLVLLNDINYDLGTIETIIMPEMHEKYKE
ncbi:MAG: hypothetical protein ACI4U9_01655, partial [Clostridia bacterium]